MASFSYYFIPAFWVLLLVLAAYLLKKPIRNIVEKQIGKFIFLPFSFRKKLMETFIRVVILNWYTILMMILLIFLLYGTDIGGDIMTGYVENLMSFNFLERMGSFISLFITIFFMSIAIWVIPFFVYSEERRTEILGRYESYYVATKLLAFFAMGPFLIVANAFIYYAIAASQSDPEKMDKNLLLMIVVNLGIFLAFPPIISVFQRISALNWVRLISRGLAEKFKNGYWQIIAKISLWVLLMAFFAAIFNVCEWSVVRIAFLVAVFIMVGSMVVFQNLYYTNESGKNEADEVKNRVVKMIQASTSHYSKSFYLTLFWLMFFCNIYFYLLPSLAATPTLYVLLIIFAFYIIFLDYCRNLFRNGSGVKKVFAFFGTILLLITPFLNHKDQFRVPYINLATEKTQVKSLETGIAERIKVIQQKTADSNLYIICAMGGGSRAGYITAGVLEKLDSLSVTEGIGTKYSLFDRTLAYSSISGGSVGTYHYIKGVQTGEIQKDTAYISYMFEKNYNTSGAFGLLFGDAFESIFRFGASGIRSLFTGNKPANKFHDRNYRIRKEYDYYLEEVLQKGTPQANGYFAKTFYPWKPKEMPLQPDSFRSFYLKQENTIPIHLVNTFEVSNGRRTILSPFPVQNRKIFPNTVFPLDDKNFDRNAPFVDIYYREAVNMSELFPLVSAAAHLGPTNMSQFVDGGYYENYGLSAGLDLIQFLLDSLKYPKDKINLILIKNSEQNANEEISKKVQIIAPLVGAMNAPFTGHANHLIEEAQRKLGENHFKIITFNAKAYDVPLTRALNKKHVLSMNHFLDTLGIGGGDLVNFIRK